MLYTEDQVRDNIRNLRGRRVFYLAPGDRLTGGARDYLLRQGVELLSAREARKDRYALLSGGWVEEKPEQLTHLNGDFLVSKTHPRIRFRGKMDSLQGELLLCMKYCPQMREKLQELLNFSHSLLSAEVLEKPVEETPLCGLTEDRIRKISHYPQTVYGIPHFMPSGEDSPELLWLNRARCAAREAELYCVEAFQDREGNPTRVDLIRALNRLSSMLYILMIEMKAGKI